MTDNSENRRNKRNTLNRTINFEINNKGGGFHVMASTAVGIDISSGGLGLQTDCKLSRGDMVKVDVPLSEGGVAVPLLAKVMWSIQVDNAYRAGLGFLA